MASQASRPSLTGGSDQAVGELGAGVTRRLAVDWIKSTAKGLTVSLLIGAGFLLVIYLGERVFPNLTYWP